jgi:hypothetical protein
LRRRVAVAFVLAVGVTTGVLAVGSYAVVRHARLGDSTARSLHQSVLNLRYATTQPDVQALFDGLRARGQSSAVVLTPGTAAQTLGAIGADRIPSELRRLVGQGSLPVSASRCRQTLRG